MLIGGAAINRDFGLRALYPKGKAADEIYEPGVFYCKDAFEGLNKMDQLIEPDGRATLVEKVRADALHFRLHGKEHAAADHRRRQRALGRADRRRRSRSRRSGARARSTCRSTTSSRTSTRTSSSSCTGAGAA